MAISGMVKVAMLAVFLESCMRIDAASESLKQDDTPSLTAAPTPADSAASNASTTMQEAGNATIEFEWELPEWTTTCTIMCLLMLVRVPVFCCWLAMIDDPCRLLRGARFKRLPSLPSADQWAGRPEEDAEDLLPDDASDDIPYTYEPASDVASELNAEVLFSLVLPLVSAAATYGGASVVGVVGGEGLGEHVSE
jgi:hypothetical protein